MSFWIVPLRLVGAMLLLTGACALVLDLSVIAIEAPVQWISAFGTAAERLALAALCFGAAAGLRALMRLEERTVRHSSALKQLLPKRIDVAPHAPTNWVDYKPRPPEPERDSGYEQRLARRRRLGIKHIDIFSPDSEK